MTEVTSFFETIQIYTRFASPFDDGYEITILIAAKDHIRIKVGYQTNGWRYLSISPFSNDREIHNHVHANRQELLLYFGAKAIHYPLYNGFDNVNLQGWAQTSCRLVYGLVIAHFSIYYDQHPLRYPLRMDLDINTLDNPSFYAIAETLKLKITTNTLPRTRREDEDISTFHSNFAVDFAIINFSMLADDFLSEDTFCSQVYRTVFPELTFQAKIVPQSVIDEYMPPLM